MRGFLGRGNLAKLITALAASLILIAGLFLFTATKAQIIPQEKSQLDQDRQTSGPLAVYDKNPKFAFRYPSDWHTYEVPSISYVRVENIDSRTLKFLTNSEREKYFKIEVVVLPSGGLSLNKWVEKQNTTSPPLPKILEQKEIEVAGHPAIYQLEQFGTHVSPAIFVAREDHVYIINPSSNKPEFREAISTFLANFAFDE
jgi:hypothetical protein